jgi:phosphohistidine swiveling domain-containing protein
MKMGIFAEKVSKDILEKIGKLNWYRHGIYRTNITFSSSYTSCLGSEWFKKEGMEKGISNIIQLGDETYVVEDEFNKLRDIMHNKIGIKFLKNYIRDYKEDNNRVIKLSESIVKKNHTNSSNEELKKDLHKFFEESKKLMHWLWSMEFLNKAFSKYIKEVIKKWQPSWNDDKIAELLTLISFVPKKLPFQKEREEVLGLKETSKEKIKELHARYAWLNINVWDGRPFTVEEYEKRIKDMIKDKEKINKGIKESNKKIKKAQEIILEIDEKNVKELLYLTQELIFLKTERIDVFTISWKNILPLIDEICRRLEINYEDLLKLTTDELLKSLDAGKVIINDFKIREKYAVARLEDDVYNYHGDDAFDAIKEVLLKEDYSQIKEVKGTIAYKGIIKGIARVLMNDRELYKLHKGDILVCNLTNPNYNPAFRKVKAVVTDEGGILCHSAIMAREFKLPCIVGTKIATSVFKDGDQVEVNADKGIVRKINK